MRGHIPVQFHRDGELAQSLQRLMHLDLAPVNVEALFRERVRQVARRDRTEQLIVLA